jgi:hypothetical protein
MIDIVGTWRLVRTTARTEDGTPLPAPYGGDKVQGRVMLNADNRMMAVLCDCRAKVPEGEHREFSSYSGNFTFDGTQLVTRVDACSDPARMGTDQVRGVRMEGEQLVLSPPLRPYPVNRGPEWRDLYWEKISDI